MEVSWQLPFGLFGAVLLGVRARPSWPLAPEHRARVLWDCWLLMGAIFFSVAGFLDEYCLSTLARGRAVAGSGGRHPGVPGPDGALHHRDLVADPRLGGAGVGRSVLLLVAAHRQRAIALTGYGLVTGARLLTPGIWSGLATLNSSANQ
jgi:hypothetical protein